MAIDVGELLVSIKADLTDLKKGLDDANKKVGEFGAGTVAKGTLIADAIKAAGTTVLKFGMDSLKAFGESQAATTKLELALKNQGLEVRNASKEMQDYATHLQRVTTFSDEAVMETQSMLVSFGLAGDELKKTTAAALDLSKGLGIDLRSATMLLGKAAQGETGSLSRFGMVISESIPKAQRFDAVLAQVNARFGGQAQAAMQNVNGKLENMSNRVNDLQERIGKFLLPVFDFWVDKLDKVSSSIEKLVGADEKAARGRELTIEALKREQQLLIDGAKARGSYRDGVVLLSAEEQKRLNLIGRSMQRERALLREETRNDDVKISSAKSRTQQIKRFAEEESAAEAKKNAEIVANLNAKTAAILSKNQTHAALMMALQQKFTQDETALLQTHMAEQEQAELIAHTKALEEMGKFNDARRVMDSALRIAQQKEADAELLATKKRNADRAANFQSTLNFIATLAQEKNRFLAAIGKTAAVSVATIDTFQAANKALASAPPPFNFGLAGAVIAAGMANVARIVGVKLAKGGMVMPSMGGTQATIGEGGQPEAVLPLGDRRTTKMLGDALAEAGGGGDMHLHFNISGNFIEGNKAKFQRMLRAAVIPEIRRYTEVSPRSSFNRRRGQS